MASDQAEPDLHGWEPIKGPRVGREAFQVTPFMRMARTHAASMGANALVMFALGGTIFLVDPAEARENVALALALTMVPFTVLAPMIGPTLDRIKGGRRWVMVGANALRVVMCLLMVGELESLMLYPLAFMVLMLDKAYNLAKSALVPSTVASDEELVKANSMLTRLSGLAGAVMAVPGGLGQLVGESVSGITGPQVNLVLASAGFVVATVLSAQIPKTRVAEKAATQEERSELRSGGILLAASAMALMRGILGFLTMLMAFEYQDSWVVLGAVVAAAAVGSFAGTFVASSLRNAGVPEERILQAVIAMVATISVIFAYAGGQVAAVLVTLLVGVAASSAKLSFDTIVQKDAPDSNRGRAFARFETRFQLVWVAGSFFPVLITIPQQAGFAVMAAVAIFAFVSYLTGLKAVQAGKPPPQRTKDFQRKMLQKASRKKSKPGMVPAGAGAADQTVTQPAGSVPQGDVDVTQTDPTEAQLTEAQREPAETSTRRLVPHADELPALPGSPRPEGDAPTRPAPPPPDSQPGSSQPQEPGAAPEPNQRSDSRVVIDPTKLQ